MLSASLERGWVAAIPILPRQASSPSKFANLGCQFRVDLSGNETSDHVVVHLGEDRGFYTGFNDAGSMCNDEKSIIMPIESIT